MSKLFFEILATVKGSISKETLIPPDFIVNKADAESIEIEIIRRDVRGRVLRWEISGNEFFQTDVNGLDQRSGTLIDSGTVVLTNNGNPIGNFYLRVRDSNTPTYNDGIQAIQFVRINEIELLQQPQFTITPLVDSVLINLVPVNNALRYILDRSLNGVDWVEVTDNYPIGSQPYTVSGLLENTVYQFRITATSDSLLFRDSFAIRETETLAVPTLPSPTDLTFEDLGSGTVRIGTVYSGPIGVTYVVERNGVGVYSGTSNTFDLSGFVDATAYVVRVKVQLAGFNDSEFYFETYTHQDAPVTWLTLEQFGGNPYYKKFDDQLTYAGLGNGTTRITYTGIENVFDAQDVGKSFCGLYAHKNPATPDFSRVNEFYPNLEGSRYSKIVTVENSKNIIVDFEYSLPKTNWVGYIFFDNSKAYSDMLDSAHLNGFEECRLVVNKTYVIPEFDNKPIARNSHFKIWTGTSDHARIKEGYEDYFQWESAKGTNIIKQSGTMFNLGVSNFNFISHNIDWIPPHRRVAEASVFGISFFGGANIGNQSRIIAIIGNNAFVEQDEIGIKNIKGNFATNALGFLYAGGTYSGSGILEDVDQSMYMLIKDFKHQGNTMQQFKANNGGGLYFVAEDVISDNRDSRGYNPWYFEGEVRLTTDKSSLAPDIVSRTYYPTHVFELTSDHSWYQIGNGFTNYGWGNAGNVIQIGGYVFWQAVGGFWKWLYEGWYSRGSTKKNWTLSESGSDNFNAKKMMMHSIPRAGQTYTIGRSYTLGTGPTIANYRNSRVRGNINWCAVLNKRWDQINPVTEIPANCIPLEFQPGDKFTIVGQGPTIYTVIQTDRLSGSGTDWVEEPRRWGRVSDEGLVYYAAEYYLDRELPSGLGLAFEVNIVESRAEELLDGVPRPMYGAYKANLELRAGDIFLPGYVVKNHDINTDMSDGNIIASDPYGHTSYPHAEVTMWAKNYDHRGDFRQSNNSYPTSFQLTVNGSVINVGPLRKYSKGYTMINCSGFVRQFNPVRQFELRDLIRKSQGINLTESQKEKVRLYNCTNMNGLESQSGPYLENYPDDTGAPDMPAVCRNLINSLP